MKYRKFGSLDWEASALGFGAMRLPIIDNEQSKIDEPEAIKMMRHAIDNGVNYIDTAYSYHDGQSEIVVGKALMDGYREKVRLATKQPHWAVKTADDFDKLLDEQLEKLQTDYLDFYLLHGIGNKSWTFLRDLDVLDWAEGATKAQLKEMLLDVLQQCRTLDRLGVSKREMTRPYKHILIAKGRPVQIDFERALITKRPKNVTQVCQWFTGSRMTAVLKEKGIHLPKQRLLACAQTYKSAYCDQDYIEIRRLVQRT